MYACKVLHITMYVCRLYTHRTNFSLEGCLQRHGLRPEPGRGFTEFSRLWANIQTDEAGLVEYRQQGGVTHLIDAVVGHTSKIVYPLPGIAYTRCVCYV